MRVERVSGSRCGFFVVLNRTSRAIARYTSVRLALAAPCWPVVTGFAIFGQAFVATLPAHAWEQNPLRGAAPSAAPSGASDVRVMGTISDEMVQQAGYDHAPQRRAAQHAPHASGEKKSGFFHGMELRMPKMPFSRGGGNANSAAANGQSMTQRSGTTVRPAPSVPRTATRFATPPNMRGGNGAIQANSSSLPPNPMAFSAQGANPMASRAQPTSPTPTAERLASPQSPQQASFAGRPQQLPQGRPQMQANPYAKRPGAMPQQAAPANSAAAQATRAPQSPADQLIVQAHELSRGAKTIDDYTRVIETCRRTTAIQPSPAVAKYASELTAWSMNRRGQLKADAGQLKEAMLDFDDAIRADSNCWRAIHNRGVLLAQSGQFEKAFDDFNRTIGLNPEFAKAHSNRAALFIVAGDLMPALQDYGRAIELDPNLAVAHRGRGRVCHLLGRLDEAVGHYDAAVQLAPDDSYAIASRADLLTDLGRYSDAANDYDRAIQIDPRSSEAHRGLAWLMATAPDDSVRDPNRAVELAEIAMQLDKKQDSVGFDTLAAAQASAGDFPAAMKTLHKAIEVAPDAERTVYQDRLVMYQHAKPFRISPVRPVTQASYQQ